MIDPKNKYNECIIRVLSKIENNDDLYKCSIIESKNENKDKFVTISSNKISNVELFLPNANDFEKYIRSQLAFFAAKEEQVQNSDKNVKNSKNNKKDKKVSADEAKDETNRTIVKQGYLEKNAKKGTFGSWKKRYVVLYSNQTVEYYSTDKLKEMKGSFNVRLENISNDYKTKETSLSGCVHTNTKNKNGFNIECDKRLWEFKATSSNERNEWVTAFKNCIQDGVKDMTQEEIAYTKNERKKTGISGFFRLVDSLFFFFFFVLVFFVGNIFSICVFVCMFVVFVLD